MLLSRAASFTACTFISRFKAALEATTIFAPQRATPQALHCWSGEGQVTTAPNTSRAFSDMDIQNIRNASEKKIIMQKHRLGEKLFTYLFSLSVTFLLPTPPRRTRPRRLSLCHLQAVPGPDAAGTPGPSPSGAAAPDPAPAAGPAAPQLGQRTADPLLPSAACPAH